MRPAGPDSGIPRRLDASALAGEIRKDELERIVLAGDSPGYFKPAFAPRDDPGWREPGRNQACPVSRTTGVQTGETTERNEAILACAVHGVPFPLVAEAEIRHRQSRHYDYRRRRRESKRRSRSPRNPELPSARMERFANSDPDLLPNL